MKKKSLSVFLILACVLFMTYCNGGPRRGSQEPVKDTQQEPEVISPVVNVYLENSGSMDGYVNGNTGFKQSVYYYLTELRDKVAPSINLFYINSKVIPLGCDVKSFIQDTNPSKFKAEGGNLGTSDIAQVLDSLLSHHKKNEVSLFISDCVVSPGKKYASNPTNIEGYLLQQRTEMTSVFRRELKKDENLTVVICQLQSLFDGKFFNKTDQWKWYKGERPFYFWLMGDVQQIKHIIDKIPWSDFKGKGAEIENLYVLTSSGQQVKYAVVNADCWGSFERERSHAEVDASKTICNAKKETKGKNVGKFRFSIGADLDRLPLGRNYLLNPQNYEVSNKDYSFEIKETSKGLFSHQMSLTTGVVAPCQITVSLKNEIPGWVDEKTDFIGQDLVADGAENKTYGLKYLLEGVQKAFTDAKSSDNYVQFTVTIK